MAFLYHIIRLGIASIGKTESVVTGFCRVCSAWAVDYSAWRFRWEDTGAGGLSQFARFEVPPA